MAPSLSSIVCWSLLWVCVCQLVQSTTATTDSVSASVKCGVSEWSVTEHESTRRIVGGQEAKRDQLPWMAHITLRYDPVVIPSNHSFTYYTDTCGGAVIDRSWVVTAAHCFPPPTEDATKYEGYHHTRTTVTLNGFNLSDPVETRTDVIAATFVLHPKYNDDALLNDIALIKLPEPLVFDHSPGSVVPICLPKEKEQFSRVDCQTAGWGRTASDSHDSKVLKVATVSMLNSKSCRKVWPKHGFFLEVCAGGSSDRTCRGDSGGPLQCRNAAGQWVLQGVTSFSDQVCESANPSVYTRVLKQVDWIHKTIKEHS